MKRWRMESQMDFGTLFESIEEPANAVASFKGMEVRYYRVVFRQFWAKKVFRDHGTCRIDPDSSVPTALFWMRSTAVSPL